MCVSKPKANILDICYDVFMLYCQLVTFKANIAMVMYVAFNKVW